MAVTGTGVFDGIIQAWRTFPKDDMLRKLSYENSVEELTSLKFDLLEERLSSDICELLTFLDTKVVTTEKAGREITDLVNKVKNLTATVIEQKKEIDQLKSESHNCKK
ncbi:Hypothetical predicted protein [Paramuricea clavata]|uniref:Uncharacterized protein n=1 Tax=Paramuricea clavata TaxID=317549 RepID=A0A6S7FY14_PARCT|nr:Hypothetical predicted protein [Paramuricea clavata]